MLCCVARNTAYSIIQNDLLKEQLKENRNRKDNDEIEMKRNREKKKEPNKKKK